MKKLRDTIKVRSTSDGTQYVRVIDILLSRKATEQFRRCSRLVEKSRNARDAGTRTAR